MENLKDYLFAYTAEYLKRCNKTMDTILLEQLKVLGITIKDPSLTHAIDSRTDEVWWFDHLILRVKWTPEFSLWYIKPEDLANIKTLDRHAPLVLNDAIVLTEEQIRDRKTSLPDEIMARTTQDLPSSGKPKAQLSSKKAQTYIRFEDSGTQHSTLSLGPFEFVQLKHNEIRGPGGESLAYLNGDCRWSIFGSCPTWSDVIFYHATEASNG